MDGDRYIAAIEISSSKIIGAVGKVGSDGQLHIIAVEQERAIEGVRYGIIQNVEDTNTRIARILNKLEMRPTVAPRKISGVYVGIAGRSLCNISHELSHNMTEETEITESFVKSLKAEALKTDIDSSLEIVDAVPHTYFVNKSETKSPIGMIGSSIRTVFDLIACRPAIKRNITRVLNDKLNLDICGYVVTPIAVADLILSPEEKRLGCMLVDLGAETTTISIYKNACLIYLATIPMGSRNITRDITSLNVLEERAEEIKITSGNALNSDKASNLNIGGIKYSDLAKIVEWRSEEIVTNIIQQVTYAGLSLDQLPAGIVVIGGGFKLNGMVQLLERQSNMQVRRGNLPAGILLEDAKAPAFESIEVISIMKAGSDMNDRAGLTVPETKPLPGTPGYETPERKDLPHEEKEIPSEKETKTPKRPGFLNMLKSNIEKMFITSEDEDDTELN